MNDLGLYPATRPTPASLMKTMQQYRWAKRLRPWVFLSIPLPMVLALIASHYHLFPQIPELLAEFLSLAFGGAVGTSMEGTIRLHRKSLGNLFAMCDLSCTPILFEFLQESIHPENPFLQERQKQQQAQTSLLRPADPVAFVGQTLLRPHQNRAVSLPEQLLRASDSPQDSVR